MKKRLLSRLGVLFVTGMLLGACFGNFALTRTVYDLNSRVVNPYLQSAVTWVFGVIIPVYPLAATVDFLLLNVIQFWTGTNPIRASVTTDDGFRLAASQEIIDGEDVLVFRNEEDHGITRRIEFRRVDEAALHARVVDTAGEVVEETIFPMQDMSAEKLSALAVMH